MPYAYALELVAGLVVALPLLTMSAERLSLPYGPYEGKGTRLSAGAATNWDVSFTIKKAKISELRAIAGTARGTLTWQDDSWRVVLAGKNIEMAGEHDRVSIDAVDATLRIEAKDLLPDLGPLEEVRPGVFRSAGDGPTIHLERGVVFLRSGDDLVSVVYRKVGEEPATRPAGATSRPSDDRAGGNHLLEKIVIDELIVRGGSVTIPLATTRPARSATRPSAP